MATPVERRDFMKGAATGALAFTVGGVDRSFAGLSPSEQHDFVEMMRQNKLQNWQGPSGQLVYMALRSDAVDVVYGTVEGYDALGIPYMPHIAPEKRW